MPRRDFPGVVFCAPFHFRRKIMNCMRRLRVTGLLLLLLCATDFAGARESCPFVRDPAFWARTPVAPAADAELTVGTLNAFRLFDAEQDADESTVLTQAQFAARIERMARYIVDDMGAPMLLALQEVEDDTALRALVQALKQESGRDYRYVPGKVSGNGDIRSALLVDTRLPVLASASLFAREARAGKPLHDRLPLVVDVDAGTHGKLTVVVVHMKSMRGMDRARDAERVTEKRLYQARELADWTRRQLAGNKRLLLLGDFNATVLDADASRSAPMKTLLAGSGLVDVAGRFLQPSQRWTYRFRCELNELDHVLVSPALAASVHDYAISRGDTCIRAREKCDTTRSVSDHDGVVLRLR